MKSFGLIEKVFRLEVVVAEAMQSRQGKSEFVGSDMWIISIVGKDRPGLIRDILGKPASNGINIVDMDQKVMQGIIVMSVIADFSSAKMTPEQLKAWLNSSAPALGIEFSLLPMEP